MIYKRPTATRDENEKPLSKKTHSTQNLLHIWKKGSNIGALADSSIILLLEKWRLHQAVKGWNIYFTQLTVLDFHTVLYGTLDFL